MSKEYELTKFSFNKSRDGLSIETTAYLAVPAEAMPGFKQWQESHEKKYRDGHSIPVVMYEKLLSQGALLHRDPAEGPAYTEVQVDRFRKSDRKVLIEQYWQSGEFVSGTPPAEKPPQQKTEPMVQTLGKLKI